MFEESDQASLVNFILQNANKEIQEIFSSKSEEPLVNFKFIIFDITDGETSLPI